MEELRPLSLTRLNFGIFVTDLFLKMVSSRHFFFLLFFSLHCSFSRFSHGLFHLRSLIGFFFVLFVLFIHTKRHGGSGVFIIDN